MRFVSIALRHHKTRKPATLAETTKRLFPEYFHQHPLAAVASRVVNEVKSPSLRFRHHEQTAGELKYL